MTLWLRDILTELAKFLLLSSIQGIYTFSFVNRSGGWHYWGICWLNWPNIFYFHLYKSLILICSDSSIGVENDTIEGFSDWSGQISFTFIYKVMNLCTFSFVNRCGGWHYWGTFWLNWPNFFYFHLYKSWILVLLIEKYHSYKSCLFPSAGILRHDAYFWNLR